MVQQNKPTDTPLPPLDSLKEGTYDFGIAIFPSQEIQDSAFWLLAQIKQKGITLTNTLDATHLPHITLFQGSFPEDPQGTLQSLLNELENKSLVLEMEDHLFVNTNGNIFWNVQITPELQKLHEEILALCKPTTKWYLMKQRIDRLTNVLSDLTEEAKTNVLKNGFAASGNLFLPHITLGKLVSRDDDAQLLDIVLPKMSFTASQIIGGPLGYHGNIESIACEKDIV